MAVAVAVAVAGMVVDVVVVVVEDVEAAGRDIVFACAQAGLVLAGSLVRRQQDAAD